MHAVRLIGRLFLITLLGVVLLFWIRTHFVSDHWSNNSARGVWVSHWSLLTGPGAVEISHSRGAAVADLPAMKGFRHTVISPSPTLLFNSVNIGVLSYVGVRYTTEPEAFVDGAAVTGGRWSVLNFSLWLPTLLLALFPVAGLALSLRRRFRHTGGFPITVPPVRGDGQP